MKGEVIAIPRVEVNSIRGESANMTLAANRQ